MGNTWKTLIRSMPILILIRIHTLALVHNGIIENYETLRTMLKEKGIQFVSETDSEVIVHLIGHVYEGNFSKSRLSKPCLCLKDPLLLLYSSDFPGQIIACANETPL